MSAQQPYRNPMATTALLVCLVPFLSSLSLLGLKYGYGPASVLYLFAQLSGVLLFGLIIIGSGLTLVAWTRANGRRDLRVYAAFAALLLAIGQVVIFQR